MAVNAKMTKKVWIISREWEIQKFCGSLENGNSQDEVTKCQTEVNNLVFNSENVQLSLFIM